MRIYYSPIKIKRALAALYGLVFVLALTISPFVAMADSNFSSCDDLDTAGMGAVGSNFLNDHRPCVSGSAYTTHWADSGSGVPIPIDATRTLYSISFIASGADANLHIGVGPSVDGGSPDLCEPVPLGGAGFVTLSLPTPYTFNSGEDIYLLTSDATDCQMAGGSHYASVVEEYGSPTSAPFSYGGMQLNFSSAIPTDTTTHIESIAPANNATTTTAVPPTFSATGWVNSVDFAAAPGNTFIRWAWSGQNLSNTACADVICAFTGGNGVGLSNTNTITAQVNADGSFSLSTTSPVVFPDGYYNLTTSIVQPNDSFSISGILGWLGYNSGFNTLAATTTSFAVGTTTAYQDLLHNALGYSVGVTASSTALLNSCSPLSGSFNIGQCTSLLFLPNAGDMQQVFDLAQNSILQRMPWGYVTRAVNIFTSSSTPSSLPSFTVHVATGSTASTSLSFDPGDMLAGGSAVLSGITDPRSGLNDRQIFEPWIQLFIALSVLIIIFHDVIGMGVHKKGQHK